MRWVLGIFAAVGLLALGLGAAAAAGLVRVGGFRPFAALDAAASAAPTASAVPQTQPAADDTSTDLTASPAALAHPGYADRAVFLSAADAVIAGPKVKVEPRNPGAKREDKPRKPGQADPSHELPDFVVRAWTTPADAAEWSFDCPRAGTYVVTFDCLAAPSWSAGKRSGPARFAVSAGGEPVPADVPEPAAGTKHHAGFQLVDVARLTLPAGPVTLRVAPRGDDKQAGLPAIRSVRLYPAE